MFVHSWCQLYFCNNLLYKTDWILLSRREDSWDMYGDSENLKEHTKRNRDALRRADARGTFSLTELGKNPHPTVTFFVDSSSSVNKPYHQRIRERLQRNVYF
jgi:hypothetical protein